MFAIDVILFASRMGLITTGNRRMQRGLKTPTDLFVLSSVAWAGIVGTGTAMCLASGDPILQFLAPTTMMGIVGGIVSRNHVVPRLAIVLVALCDIPLQFVLPFTGSFWFLVSAVQCPMFIVSLIGTVQRFSRYHVALLVAQRESEHRAAHDALTGLLNRSGLIEALVAGLTDAFNQNRDLALLYLDLDGFKSVNDSFGHAAGDALLVQVGERVSAMLPEGSLLARIGGDEFVALSPVCSVARARGVAVGVIAALAEPFELGPPVRVTIGASVGIANAVPGMTSERLLAEADAALYRAKMDGKGRCVVASEIRQVAAESSIAA